MKYFFSLAIFLSGLVFSEAGEFKVATLHPLVLDLVRQVGGDKVQIIDLIGLNSDPHTFQPEPKQIAAADGAKLYFASGMSLENYLPKLRDILAGKVRLVEVGEKLPKLYGACDHEGHHHDHEHDYDPHWWHSVEHFSRATQIVADELSAENPENQAFYQSNAKIYREKLEKLHQWVKREVIRIPKEQRKLATAHDAFQYFCEAYGFEAFPVQGINREQMPDAKKLAELISTLKSENVNAIFPEKESNPKILQSLTRDTGIRLAGELTADGRGTDDYEVMIRHNVGVIVAALSGE